MENKEELKQLKNDEELKDVTGGTIFKRPSRDVLETSKNGPVDPSEIESIEVLK